MNSEPLPVREFVCPDEAATRHCAALLAAEVLPLSGLVIALNGPLGAGKTCFTRALAEALGVPPEEVNSPTYVILQHYQGRLPILHFDLYRLANEDEWDELGAESLLDGESLCLIEWASRIPEHTLGDHLSVNIAAVGMTERIFRVQAYGDRPANILDNWWNAWNDRAN